MSIRIETTYSGCVSTDIDLPEGKSWSDVQESYVKYHILHLRLKGEDDWLDFPLYEPMPMDEWIDYKRPDVVSVYDHDEALLTEY